MPAPRKIVSAKQVVVEGKDAGVFVEAFLESLGMPDAQVQDFGGNSELRSFLKALRNVPGFDSIVSSLGIIRDAEQDPQAAFQSVCGALTHAGLPVPAQVAVPTGGDPTVNVFILPNAATPGMLEDICMQTVNDEVQGCINQYLHCVKGIEGHLPSPIAKGRVATFLASRSRPGLRVGHAASAGYWPWNHDAFRPLGDFLKAL